MKLQHSGKPADCRSAWLDSVPRWRLRLRLAHLRLELWRRRHGRRRRSDPDLIRLGKHVTVTDLRPDASIDDDAST